MLACRSATVIFFAFIFLPAGCQNFRPCSSDSACGSGDFIPAQVRLQPSFTQIIESDESAGKPDSIIAYVEIKDQFGDPIKTLGTFRFEIFKYRPAFSDPRGQRFPNRGIQEVNLSQLSVNQQHWDSSTRTYKIPLLLPPLPENLKRIVLQVTFTIGPDYRLQNYITLER